MQNQRPLRLVLGAILLTAIMPPNLSAAGIEAVKGKRYTLTKRHGPWMIMVASVSGENAEPAADALVYELRRKGIPAYAYHQKAEFEEINTFDRFGRMRQRKQVTQDEQIGVIAGNYESVDDRIAQKTLEYIKNMYPKSVGGGIYYKTPGKPLPLSGAFLTINPFLSPEEVAQRKRDPLLLKLNSGSDVSLLDNPGKYTLVVKSYHGKSVAEIGEKFDAVASKFEVSDALDEAAMNAWHLAKILRAREVEAYVFHDRNRSVVTVGSFDSPDDPRIRDLFEKFQAKTKRNEATGQEVFTTEIIYAPGPNKGDPPVPWLFDPTPQLMLVPKLR